MKKQNPLRQTRRTHYVAYVAASIDGRISLTTTREPEWTSKEDWKFFQKSLSLADAVVVGRNTYLTVQKRLDRRNTFVLSSRVRTLEKKGAVWFVNPKRTDLKKLLGKYKTVAVIGGQSVYQTMLDANLLDELFVTIEPLVFGRGKEMFSGGTKTKYFALRSARTLNRCGTVLLHYHIKQ